MENRAAFLKLFVIMMLVSCSTPVIGQTYPITGINILLPAAPEPNISNWGQGRSQFAITATAASVGGRIDPAARESKMLVIIKNNGIKVCGTYTVNSAPPANFSTVNKVWNGNTAVSFLGKGCRLPPGDYELNVQFFGYKNGKIVALSEEVSKAFSIRGNDKPTDQQQGVINAGIVRDAKQTNLNRPGDQQPGVINPRVEPETKEANRMRPADQQGDGAKPTNTNKPADQLAGAFSPAVEPETKPANPKKPGLLSRLGKIAVSSTGFGGTININLSSPGACDCGNWSPITINRTMKFDCGGKNVIPWKCGQLFNFLSTYNCTSKDKSCQAVTGWEIKKDGVSIVGGQGDQNITGEFIAQANGNYTLTLTAACNGKKCEPCVYTIAVEDCKTCDCGTWGPLLVNRDVKYDCGYKNRIPWKCNQPFNFASVYRCGASSQNCEAITSWEIARDGTTIKTGEGANNVADTFTPTANGTYTLTLNADCNGIKCPPCVYTIAIEDCTTCDCGTWSPLAVNNAVKFENGVKNTIPWKCSQLFSFTSAYHCGLNNQSCQAVTSWEIDKDGVAIKTGNSKIDVADAFTPTANGTYTITLNADCNGIKCPPAVYNVVIEDCTTCDCGNWVSPLVNIRANGSVVAGLKCGESVALSKGSYSFAIPNYRCGLNDASCVVSYSWSVQGGPVVVNGTRQTFNYNFGQPGTYTIDITPICGGKKCRQCKLQVIVQDNLPPVNEEKPEKKKPVTVEQHYYYVISPEYAGEVVSVKDTLFLQIENNYSSGSNQLSYTIRNLSNDKTSRLTKLAITNNQGLIRIALPLQNSVVLKGETGQLIMGDYKKYYYISFKRN
ncbi:hypothetical protein [Mucilaginibacter sp.]|uniref:hypothetical protein n=1 Tax=Mucilaginibacter sp. TaxID=1882438 RepID=UPI002840B853|nr:hypothetical protein [Mucilaginibacter sp.]MDR3697049.1 hypothetical protein [Mucilaginibacter sp.]